MAMVKSKKLSYKIADIIIYIVLTVAAILCLIPIVNTIAISFSSRAAATSGKVTFWPIEPTLAAYEAIMQDDQFFRSFFISVIRVILGGIVNMTLMILTAFPLSKSKKYFPQRNAYMWSFVFTMLFSGGLVPEYLLVYKLHLIDTIWALILPGALPIFNMIILMNFFKGIPNELDEAARIDGATPMVVLLRIFLPLAVPSLATVGLFTIVVHWNAFFDGIIYINDATKIPLSTYIQQLVVEIADTSHMTFEEIERMEMVSSRNFNAAKVFVTMLPVLVIYPFLQKYFVKGLVIGSVKG